jgi:hypothetical protein
MRQLKQFKSTWKRRVAAAPITLCLITALALTGYVSSSSAGASPPARGTSAAAELTGASKSGCPTGTGAGVTKTTATVAISVIDITGGSLSNTTVGVPTPQGQEADWNLVANNINKNGGAGCRKLVLKFYDVNPIDTAGAEQVCLQIAASHPFIVLDSGALSNVGASDCIPNAKVPLASQYLTQAQLSKYYPYYLSLVDVPTDTITTSTLGMGKLGYFTAAKGFKKLGLIYSTCAPSYVVAEQAALKKAGVPSSKIVTFNVGCPAGQDYTPAMLSQAVLSFKSAGVTNVTDAQAGSAMAVFTQVAAQQNYKPKYTLTNSEVIVANFSGADAPNAANLGGAVNAVTSSYGEQTTPGYKPTAGTAKCNAIFKAAGQPTLYKQLDGYGGIACDYLWFVQALLDNAKSVQADKVAAAEHAIGSINYSYPATPVDYSAAPNGAVYGLDYWRIADFVASCTCWHIPDPTWNAPLK